MKAPTEILNPAMYEIIGETAFSYLATVRKLRSEGKDVVSFGIGQPDFPTPKHIVEAAKKALDEGFTGYTETAGIPELREAISEYLSRYGKVSPDEIIVTTGAKTAIFLGISAFLKPGDEIIILDPSYYAYSQIAKFIGAKPVFLPMNFEPDKGFSIDVERLEDMITDKTRGIAINNPHNPTGTVFTPEELDYVMDLARKHNLVIFVDEIYDNFVFHGARFKSFLSYPDWRDYVVYINGFSKTFSMTGWRLGYVVVREEVVPRLLDLAVSLYSCAPSFVQKAGVEALKGDWTPVNRMIEEFERRSKRLYEILSEAEGIEAYLPMGAFYMFPRVKTLLEKSKLDVYKLVDKLLYDYLVLVLPGTSFPGNIGRDYVRLSFATSMEDIEKGAQRIVKASKELV
ncbi:MAG: pyridoxal phosphate-dependent aminotransferase [Desulfurococcales archaeon]|nr:pyridoxal phosphate-dependent aminotransferase [Desulfurococcales archaeon]